MEDAPIQILEVRAGEPPSPVMVTAALSAGASCAIFVALSEQLDRRRRAPVTSGDDVMALRLQVALLERFAPLASAGAHTIAQFTEPEIRACLLDLTAYAGRVNGEYFQPRELRERLHTIEQLTAVLVAVEVTASAAGGAPLTLAAR